MIVAVPFDKILMGVSALLRSVRGFRRTISTGRSCACLRPEWWGLNDVLLNENMAYRWGENLPSEWATGQVLITASAFCGVERMRLACRWQGTDWHTDWLTDSSRNSKRGPKKTVWGFTVRLNGISRISVRRSEAFLQFTVFKRLTLL